MIMVVIDSSIDKDKIIEVLELAKYYQQLLNELDKKQVALAKAIQKLTPYELEFYKKQLPRVIAKCQ